MNSILKVVVVIALYFPVNGVAQTLTLPHYGEGTSGSVDKYLTTKLDNGEIVPWFPIQEVVVTRKRVWKNEKDRQNYLRLRRNIIRVLPYAIYAQERYEQLDRDLAMAANRREEKRLINECEVEIKEKFNNEIKNLTISQGQILVKLIERQTSNTSYDLLKDMKGGVTAFLYQGVARVFGHNLKSVYDPEEDFEIENIIREYEKVRHIRRSPYN